MSEQQIAEIEISKSEAEKIVNFSETLDRLFKNRDFKKVITEGYLKDEAVRLVCLKGAPEVQNEKQQAAIVKQIDSIGALRNYFRTIWANGDAAKALIEEADQALQEIHEESLQEEDY